MSAPSPLRPSLYTVLPLVGLLAYLVANGTIPLFRKPPQAAVVKDSGQDLLAAAVSVTRAIPADFADHVVITGSLVPREEIMVGPEVEGLRVVEVLADEGDRVKKGQVLARLVTDVLDAQVAQNDAALAKATAAIAQSRSSIASAEAKVVEARNAFERGRPLNKSGYISDSVQDQRESAAKIAEAALVSARDALKVSEADKKQVEAQRRELDWKRGRTEVPAPEAGVISRRVARVGGFVAGVGDPMFRIIARNEIELEAEVLDTQLARLKDGQPVSVTLPGGGEASGKVRIVSPEIDKTTRLGRVRVFLGENPDLRVGGFARGVITTTRSRGLAVPASAVLYGEGGTTTVQLVRDGKIVSKPVKLGLAQGNDVEIREGLAEGDMIVSRSGTFLREGDAVRPMTKPAKLSKVDQ
jgi:HlyD family secretion protein